MTECLRCRGRMTEGFAYDPNSGARLQWLDGEASFWKLLTSGFKGKARELVSRRCSDCGHVEFFADVNVKPVRTLATLEGENEQLRRLVTRLQDRVGTLETIVTDPADRISREIDEVRALPSMSEKSST